MYRTPQKGNTGSLVGQGAGFLLSPFLGPLAPKVGGVLGGLFDTFSFNNDARKIQRASARKEGFYNSMYADIANQREVQLREDVY